MSASVTQRGGCLKCGAMGHWARDCTAPKSQWITRAGQESQQQNDELDSTNQTADQNPVPEQNTQTVPLGAAAAAKKKRQRPKLTFDLLKETAGLPDIYHNFPTLFKQQFRGKGHEVSDVRRLLEMYKRWQDRIFPHGEFDHFIASLQNLGGKNIVKSELQDMRVNLLKVAESSMMVNVPPADDHPQQANSDEDAEGLMEMALVDDALAADGGDGDDDEFVAMMGDDMDDDELLEMAMTQQEGDNDNTIDMDDDELLEMAMQQQDIIQ